MSVRCNTNHFTLCILWTSIFLAALAKEDLDASSLHDVFASSLPEDLLEKKLVSENVDVLDILDYHNTTFGDPTSPRRIKHFVLGYVTPWNNKGYDRAVKYASKFTHIAPVWLQVLPDKTDGKYQMRGMHDIDHGWIERIKQGNAKTKIVPRVLLEGFDGRSWTSLIMNEDHALEMASTIIRVLQQHKMDGAVLEMWKPMPDDTARRAMRAMIRVVGERLKKDGLQSILVVPPSGGQNVPGRLRNEDFKALSDSVDAVSVMTYDHPDTYSSAGAVAPLDWMLDSMDHIVPAKEKSKGKKLLLGLNHYGYDFTRKSGANAIVGTTYLQQLTEYHPQLQWDAKAAEHVYKYRKDSEEHVVHFPTLKSLDTRINLAKKRGFGLAIWDLGQGLDYFFDIL